MIRDAVYILDSKNISGAETIWKIDDEWREILSYDEEIIEGTGGLYVKKAGNDWLVAKGDHD